LKTTICIVQQYSVNNQPHVSTQDGYTSQASKFFYLPIDAQVNYFKRIFKFTLKQFLHVSV